MNQRRTYANRRQQNYRGQQYVQGSAAPKLDIRRQMEEEETTYHVSRETRKNREKLHTMSPAYVVLLLLALVLAGYVLTRYISLQSRVTAQVATINQKESELSKLQQENDEEWSRVNNSIDLEEIKAIAIGELGMTYAQEGQIVTYSNEGTDYMRKVVEE